jgi:hypothetical protein
MPMPLLLLIMVLFLAVAAAGCARPEARPNGPERAGQDVAFTAVVRWIPLEGGFFGLVARDGTKYLPLNLPEGFRRDGLGVEVRGRLGEEAVTAYMWGRPLMILDIEVLE